MIGEQLEWVILGVTEKDELFDVPGWPERLCGMLADQGQDNRMSYSSYLRPAHIRGRPVVIVESRLAQDDPASFAIVARFVAENQLKTRPGRSDRITGKYPAFQQERREYIKG
ncbi:MAG: DUF3579 domain-containing protein [Gallionella sp.]|jgi:hypothetical protein